MRLFFDRLFDATGLLAGLFMIGTLLAVLSSIFGRVIPALGLPGADAYAYASHHEHREGIRAFLEKRPPVF